MACCKDITFTVSGGCISGGGNDPVPMSMVVTQDVVISTFTLTPLSPIGPPVVPTIDAVTNTKDFGPIPIGNYKLVYNNGSLLGVRGDLGIFDCLPSHVMSVRFTGTELPASAAFVSFNCYPRVNQLVGNIACRLCDVVDPCSAATMQNDTLAANPIYLPQVDSATYGNDLPTPTANMFAGINASSYWQNTNGMSWSLINTQHIYPQPTCVKIQNWTSVRAELGTCPDCVVPSVWCAVLGPQYCVSPQEWDGVFRFRKCYFPAGTDQQVNFFASQVGDGGGLADAVFWTINGNAIATTVQYETAVQYRFVAGVPYWELRIICYEDPNTGYIKAMWVGRKTIGTDPTGLYTLDPTSGSCSSGPATICIETCDHIDPVIHIDNISTAPQLLFGTSCYAPHP